jgi:hypothetical protein
LGVIGDKKYSIGHFSVYVFVLIAFTFHFGYSVYGEMPQKFGGGKPRSIIIVANKDDIEILNALGFNVNSKKFDDTVEMIFSTSDKYILKKGEKILSLSKGLFCGFISKQENSLLPE